MCGFHTGYHIFVISVSYCRTVLLLVNMLVEYCQCVDDTPMLVTDIMNKLFEILKVSNKVAIKLNFRLVINSVKFTLLGKHAIKKKNYS